jgi:hypothetical protein
MIADVKGYEFGGPWDPARVYPGHVFFVPPDTLLVEEAARLGITSADDLFGGVVPHCFVKTKAITHVLVGPRAARPAGWCDAFAVSVMPFVLRGFTAFAREDAREAAQRLFDDGAVRVKPTLASGSRGQRIALMLDEIEEALDAVTDDELAGCGIVLETNLKDVRTFSVGQVHMHGDTVSYLGAQRETHDNDGATVYGGSDLTVVRGGWDALDRLPVDRETRQIVLHAIRYDQATRAYPAMFTSRRNYDVSVGVDGRGRSCVGVLEQSWRIGGASAAELTALQALRREPRLDVVSVSTVERYGEGLTIPRDALVHYHGVDAIAGPVVRYTRIVESRAA